MTEETTPPLVHKYGLNRRLKCRDDHLSSLPEGERSFHWQPVTCLLCLQHQSKKAKSRLEKAAVLKDVG